MSQYPRPVQGLIEPEFQPVADLFAAQLQRSRGGAAACVYLHGQPVLDIFGGVRDESGAPWQRDTACVSYSTTKGVIATALHVLADRGLLDYDQPVARYWPEFAQSGKHAITVRQVLCHRAGLSEIRELIDNVDQLLEWDRVVDALARTAADPPPAGSTAYQAITWGFLVGELIRRISGREIPDFVRDELATPLGLDGLFVGGPEVAVQRAARLVDHPARRAHRQPGRVGGARSARTVESQQKRQKRRDLAWRAFAGGLRLFGHPVDLSRMRGALFPRGIAGFDFSSDRVLRACIPAANGMFTARSLARLYAALAAGGALDGARIMSPATIARATQVQYPGYDQVTVVNMRWRLGYHRVITLRGVPPQAFGHFGWGGSGAWGDPERGLSFGYVVNTGSGTPVGDLRISRLSTVLIRCVDRMQRRTRWRPRRRGQR